MASDSHWSNYLTTSPPRNTYPKVNEAAPTALSVDSMLAEAHLPLARVAQEYDWDFIEAEKEFTRAY